MPLLFSSFLSFKKDGCLCFCRRRCSTSCSWRGVRRSRSLCTARTAPSNPPHPGRLRHPLPVRDKRPDADLRQLCHVPGTFPHAPVSLITSAVARLKWLLLNVAFVVSGFAWSLKVWGKWDKLFKALKVCKNSGDCESLWILWSSEHYGKTISLSVRNCISQDRTAVDLKKKLACKIQKNALPISFDW